MSLSNSGQIAVALAFGGGVVLSLLLSLLRISEMLRVGLVFAGPLVAFVVFGIGAPDCFGECLARTSWALISTAAVTGWLVGWGISSLVRRLSRAD